MSPRQRLFRAWHALEDQGATVRRVRIGGLSDRELGALAEDAEHRLRVLAEGRDAGWLPWAEGAVA